jgi:hypothetical protein
MDTDLKRKIEKYVNNAFTAAQLKANEAAQIETANVRARLAKTGNVFSSAMDHQMVRIESEKINTLLKVRGDALLDAYEIYGVLFDEAAILQDVANMRSTLIAAISGSARSQDVLTAMRTGKNDLAGSMRYENFQRQLTIHTQTIAKELSCQIEQRKVTPKMKRPEAGVNITYHLRDNARVNINSKDQSVNNVTVTQQQLFTTIRDTVTQQITGKDQETILAKLDELEYAQGTKSFSEKFTAFLAVTADYITILGPFIPALAEFAKKSLGA